MLTIFSVGWGFSIASSEMKPILATKELVIPEGIEVTVKSRRIIVKGPRGQLSKDLSHIAADMFLVEEEGEKKLKVEIHFSSRKGLSSLRTVVSHVSNMITGVTKGFRCESACRHACMECRTHTNAWNLIIHRLTVFLHM